ncbi:MAG: 30S ribosomal protein S6 [Candidatus Kaiserbacteria bacterium]|nr:30S ribosomal protein S6 [Candidatus Kaiserbacteria bacterium]
MANKSEQKVYEVSFHLVPSIDADKVSVAFDRVKGVVSEHGEMLSEVFPELCDLVYTIRHTVRQRDGSYNRYDEAYFGSVKFRSLRDGVKQIERVLYDDAEVLRFLLLETVVDDTRIGEVLPGTEEEEEEVTDRDDKKADTAAASGKDGQGAGESGIAAQPDEEGGAAAG